MWSDDTITFPVSGARSVCAAKPNVAPLPHLLGACLSLSNGTWSNLGRSITGPGAVLPEHSRNVRTPETYNCLILSTSWVLLRPHIFKGKNGEISGFLYRKPGPEGFGTAWHPKGRSAAPRVTKLRDRPANLKTGSPQGPCRQGRGRSAAGVVAAPGRVPLSGPPKALLGANGHPRRTPGCRWVGFGVAHNPLIIDAIYPWPWFGVGYEGRPVQPPVGDPRKP